MYIFQIVNLMSVISHEISCQVFSISLHNESLHASIIICRLQSAHAHYSRIICNDICIYVMQVNIK